MLIEMKSVLFAMTLFVCISGASAAPVVPEIKAPVAAKAAVANPLENIDVVLLVNGVATTGTMTITSFTTQGRNLLAVATLSFTTLTGVVTETVTLPASVTGSCSILDLHLGAIHLDLLGLQVDLAAVDLDIVAQTGAGNLLGNLLCAITNLLNSNAAGNALARVAALLNDVLAAL
jgi:hypothetical protein